MKRTVLLFCVTMLLLFGGCAPEKGDYFAPFQGGFTARIKGTWQSLSFEAQLAASAPGESGARAMTLTFYAPSTLSGTVLTREGTGALTLAVDGVSLPLSGVAATGYGALFDLFPSEGEIHTVTRENGNTCLDGVGFSLTLASDGTPLAAENAVARVEITEWEMR